MMTTFGELLRVDREKLKFSQEQLAKMLGVSQQAVANWEAGTAHPRRERRARLLQILGPQSELAKNPPRTEFIPAEDQPVSQSTTKLRAQRLEASAMATDPEFKRQSEESARRFEDARRRVESTMERHRLAREEFMHALPDELRVYVDGHITVGAATRRLDYLSPRRGVELKRTPSSKFMAWVNAAPALVNLAVVRGIADQGLRPPRDYSLVFVTDGAPALSGSAMQKVMFDAGVLGVSVYQVESYTQAAELIAELETEGEDVTDVTDDDQPNPDADTW
jgi:transcriptional regulator with XRE-family HTH domain